MVYVREDIPHSRLPLIEIADPEYHIESMILLVQMKNLKFHLTCLYKNPKVSKNVFIEHVSTMLDKLCAGSEENVLVGDVNIDMGTNGNAFDNQICDVYGLTNIVQSNTCFKGQEGSLIDPVIVSNTSKFQASFNITCGVSDCHNMVGCLTKAFYEKRQPRKIKYRSYKSFSESSFKKDVSHIPSQVCDVFDDIDDQYWAFNVMFKEVLDEHAPIKERTVKTDKIPYMHSSLRQEMYKRSRLKNIFLKNKTSDNWENYKKQRNRTTSLRKKAIKSYFVKKCSNSSSPKDFWNCVKPFFATNSAKNCSQIILKENNEIVSDSREVANILNDYFIDIAHEIKDTQLNSCDVQEIIRHHESHSSIVSINSESQSDSRFDFGEISFDNILKKLRGIQTNKSTGYDSINPKCVSFCASELAAPMTSLMNNAFKTNTFPQDMKKAEISPVFKKKDHLCKDNYRPINLVTVFSKLFESIIAEQISDFMSSRLNSKLGAYRKGHGCSQVLTLAVNSWKWSLDENLFVGALLMDLSKAFDSIPHDLLISKFYSYGFSANACKFMLSYMNNRMQRVKVRGAYSEWKLTKRGIPQGSCLGPLLFNIYVNDMFSCVENCQVFNYADDNTVSACHQNINELIDIILNDTNNLIKWFNDNFMKVNPEKFQLLLLKPKGINTELPQKINVGEFDLTTSQNVTLLGIKIDSNLNFNEHVSLLCKKANRQLKVMYRFKTLLGKKEKGIIFKTFILSNFNFCPVVWAFCSVTSMRKIEKVQERALRFLTDDISSEYRDLLNVTNSTTMLLARLKAIALEVFKCIHELNPEFLNSLFQSKANIYGMRDQNRLVIPKFNKHQYGKQTFSYYGSHIWNILPNDLKKCVDLKMFKELLSKWEGPRCSCNLCSIIIC